MKRTTCRWLSSSFWIWQNRSKAIPLWLPPPQFQPSSVPDSLSFSLSLCSSLPAARVAARVQSRVCEMEGGFTNSHSERHIGWWGNPYLHRAKQIFTSNTPPTLTLIFVLTNLSKLRAGSEYDFEIIIIDDNSPDGTAEVTLNYQPCTPLSLEKTKLRDSRLDNSSSHNSPLGKIINFH